MKQKSSGQVSLLKNKKNIYCEHVSGNGSLQSHGVSHTFVMQNLNSLLPNSFFPQKWPKRRFLIFRIFFLFLFCILFLKLLFLNIFKTFSLPPGATKTQRPTLGQKKNILETFILQNHKINIILQKPT